MPWPKGKQMTTEHIAKRTEGRALSGKCFKKPRHVDEQELWQCSKCKRWLPRELFYRRKTSHNGLTSRCKTCSIETTMQTRDLDRKRDSNRQFMRGYRTRNLEKCQERERDYSAMRAQTQQVKVRAILNAAVRQGKVVRPARCERCGVSGRIVAHHYDYEQPLNVIWLCDECHGVVHREINDAHKECMS